MAAEKFSRASRFTTFHLGTSKSTSTKTLLHAYFNEHVLHRCTECGQLIGGEFSPRERESKASHLRASLVLPVLLFCLFAGCPPPIPSVTSPSDPRQLTQACNAWFVTGTFSPRPVFQLCAFKSARTSFKRRVEFDNERLIGEKIVTLTIFYHLILFPVFKFLNH